MYNSQNSNLSLSINLKKKKARKREEREREEKGESKPVSRGVKKVMRLRRSGSLSLIYGPNLPPQSLSISIQSPKQTQKERKTRKKKEKAKQKTKIKIKIKIKIKTKKQKEFNPKRYLFPNRASVALVRFPAVTSSTSLRRTDQRNTLQSPTLAHTNPHDDLSYLIRFLLTFLGVRFFPSRAWMSGEASDGKSV